MKNIMVWGGTHPNEQFSLDVADSLIANPIPGVTAGIANLKARELGMRFVDINLNGGYPGDADSAVYEKHRAKEVLALSQGFDVVIDFHGASFAKESYAVISERHVRRSSLNFIAGVGINNVLLSTYNTLHEHVPGSFLLDIVMDGPLADVSLWRRAFDQLANGVEYPEANASDFRWFDTVENLHERQLPISADSSDITSFSHLPDALAKQAGFDWPVCVIAKFPPAEGGYWAEICRPIDAPDISGLD